MSTQIYGASDDLIEFEGDLHGEVGAYGHEPENPVLLLCSDGTILAVGYGKADRGIWSIVLVARGTLFETIDPCDDEDAARYSDTAVFRDGLTFAYAAKEWERVK